MPYFRVSVTQKLSPEKAEELAAGLGEALETIPGKTRNMLMLDLEDGKIMFSGGKRQENFAFTEIHYFSNFSYTVKKRLTEAVFAVFARVLDIKPECASLTITERHCWGGFGNFHDEFYPGE